MLAMYGHPWNSVHGVSPQEPDGKLTVAGDTWGKALAGVTGRQMAAGLAACLSSGDEFPPSAPRFRAMCLGIPSLVAVRLDRAGNDPFTVLVMRSLDQYRFKLADANVADRMLREAYAEAREFVMRGGELPEVAAQIADEVPARPALVLPTPAGTALADEARELLHGKMAAAGPDA